MADPANKTQIGGDHYKKKNITKDQVPEGGLDVWDIVWLWKRDHFTATAIKYLARWEDKGGKEDLKKAVHWIQKRIELLEKEESENSYTNKVIQDEYLRTWKALYNSRPFSGNIK